MEWNKLLSPKTKMERKKEPEKFFEYPINDMETDYEQIISSSAFRRLQDKTQVFPLDKSDFVRTRLTHSIEVSSIARQLGIMIQKTPEKYGPNLFENENKNIIENIPSILACAGLLHDIGNPPFGHFGEAIIGDWFKKELEKDDFNFNNKPIRKILNDQMKRDLENFEGNAQAIRILTRLHSNSNDVNLSYSILNTLMKYPTDSTNFSNKDENIKKHKLGYYYSENNIVKDICQTTGTEIEGEYVRHPLTFLLEAADDIAYATADLEDAFKKGLFTIEQFIDYYQGEINEIKDKDTHYAEEILVNLKERVKTNEDIFSAFQKCMNFTKKWLMYVVVYRFYKSFDDIMEGSYKHDLFYGTFHEYTIGILKGAMKKFVFDDTEILKLELSAKKIIEAFLNDFIYAVRYWNEDKNCEKKISKSDKKYINIISQSLRDEYMKTEPKSESERLYNKFMMVIDFISGMTDSYAKTLYQELYGIY